MPTLSQIHTIHYARPRQSIFYVTRALNRFLLHQRQLTLTLSDKPLELKPKKVVYIGMIKR